jgi:hypothetical protein
LLAVVVELLDELSLALILAEAVLVCEDDAVIDAVMLLETLALAVGDGLIQPEG